MDLTPLLDAARDLRAFVQEHIQRFASEVGDRVARLTGP
jgi:hypothetical protein